jgi:hypothetical protein
MTVQHEDHTTAGAIVADGLMRLAKEGKVRERETTMKDMIKLGKHGWADYVDALGVKYDGGHGCWLYSSLNYRCCILQADLGHEAAWHKTFSPFEGQKGLLFSGGHKPEKYGLKAVASYGGIYFVIDADPYQHYNSDRDLPLRERRRKEKL